jgi:hypothetical protein
MEPEIKALLAEWTPRQISKLTKLERHLEDKGIPKQQRDNVLRHISQSNGPLPVLPRTQVVREAEEAGWTEEQIEIVARLEVYLTARGMPKGQRDPALRRIIWQAEPLHELHLVYSKMNNQHSHHEANRNKGRERIEIIEEAMAKGIQGKQAIHDYVKDRKKELLYPSKKRGKKGEFISPANMMKHFYHNTRPGQKAKEHS